MRYLFLALLLLAFRSGTPETWYFAQMIDSGEIAAFTADGTVRPLSVKGDWQFGLRIDASTVLLAVTPQGESTRLYRVTPDDAVQIAVPGSVEDFRQPLAFFEPYVVLRQNSSLLPTTAVLINVATAQAEPLRGKLPQVARMSADGAALRYMSVVGEQWSLLERTLDTGVERVIDSFTTDNPLPLVSSDAHGDRWIFETRAENRLPTYNLLSIDGTRTTLDSGTREQPVRWSFVSGDLVGSAFGCGATCAFQVLGASSEITIPLPSEGIFTPLVEPQPGEILALDDARNFWLLKAGAAARLLGQYDALRIFMPPHQLISPDARYVLTATGDEQYGVWDLGTGAPVALVNARFIGLILYNEHGFLIHSYGDDTDNGIAYRYADGETSSLPNTNVGIYLDLLADGTVIYMLQRAADDIGEPGIYRYDPARQTYTPILPGARLTYPQALE